MVIYSGSRLGSAPHLIRYVEKQLRSLGVKVAGLKKVDLLNIHQNLGNINSLGKILGITEVPRLQTIQAHLMSGVPVDFGDDPNFGLSAGEATYLGLRLRQIGLDPDVLPKVGAMLAEAKNIPDFLKVFNEGIINYIGKEEAGEYVDHCKRVAKYELALAQDFKLPPEDQEVIEASAHLHDLGKAGVKRSIILKRGLLTPAEQEAMQKHAQYGAYLLKLIDPRGENALLKKITPVILYHHEDFNGGGYPFGLAGEEIPYLARLLRVGDAFDAMTTRKFRGKRTEILSFEKAQEELKVFSGKQFDPQIVDSLLKLLK